MGLTNKTHEFKDGFIFVVEIVVLSLCFGFIGAFLGFVLGH